jgi:hypothetical protein
LLCFCKNNKGMTTVNHETQNQTQPTYISLGYRCSTAGILKRLGLKHESFPFDWMISRLPIIKDCIETRFAYFIDPKWYVKKQTHTTHYHKGTTPVPMKICDETIYENVHYANLYQDQVQTPKTMNIPQPLSRENGDTYAHLLAINHRNINDPETQAYYARCIDRFFHYWEPTTPTPTPVVGIYIHPTITEQEYQDQTNDLQQEFRELYEKTMPKHWSAVFFIIVRTNHPYPITDHLPDCLQILYTDTTNQQQPTTTQTPTRNIRIYVVYTNCDFVDAGEIFMHNPYIEIDKIMGGTKVPP